MAATEKTISAFVESQLPDFINADHPKLKKFLEYYYKWLEQNNPNGISNTAGNTLYHAMQIGDYRDVDDVPIEFLKYLKNELAPYFPENSSLDMRKIIKSAREFYSKKGSDESVRWLFKVLFNEEIELNYPKEQILIASDGKWKKPRAFRITVSETNKNVDINRLEKRLAIGNISGATCVIESANRTVDATSGREIIEIYISNIKRFFENGEYITVEYEDENGVSKVFSEKIIGTLSNLRVDSSIQTDPQQKRRGLLYNVGDPVVITGGLAATSEAEDAIGIVGNVSQGSIEAVTIVFPGYGYRVYTDSDVLVFRSTGDDPNANANTDLRVLALNLTQNITHSQQNFVEAITYDKAVIDYAGDEVIGNANLGFFTVNNRNILLNVTETNYTADFQNNEQVWANGTNFFDALFTAKIATPNATSGGIFGGNVANATGGLLLYDVSNTGLLATVLTGAQINSKNTAKGFTYNSITTAVVEANANSQIVQCIDFETVNTGGIALISVVDGGFGFRTAPEIQVDTHYDTHISENYTFSTQEAQKRQFWQTFKDLGQVAHVYIDAGGTGYANGDTITFSGRGYGGNGYVNVNATGSIFSVTITDRGEGYLTRPSVSITTSGGSGAAFTAYLFGDGLDQTISTSAIGRIRDLRLVYRGFDYTSTPNTSLKVVDTVINAVPDANNFYEQEYIYQGSSLTNSTFRANVKSYSRTTKLLRLYNYSGTLNPALDLVTANGVYCNVNAAATVPAPSQYPAAVITTGLPNPMYYGNGRARARASFANGLIEFNGFFINTDGFPSADKVLEDKSLYHNFSYIIQSEKPLLEFETPLKSIAHPAGLEVVAKTVLKNENYDINLAEANVDLILPGNTGSLINIANPYSNVVTGIDTEFLAPANKVNVGDLFIIVDSGNPLRGISKIVSNVISNTSLEVFGDFIYPGQGKLKTTNDSLTLQIFGNTNTISDFIQVGDSVKFNVTNFQLAGTVNISGSVITGNTTAPNVTYFVGNVVVGSEVTVNGEVRLITTVTNNQHLIVNSNFTNAGTNKYINANSVLVKTVSAISGNNLTANSKVFANATNLVYIVAPDYASTNYDYKVITLTDE